MHLTLCGVKMRFAVVIAVVVALAAATAASAPDLTHMYRVKPRGEAAVNAANSACSEMYHEGDGIYHVRVFPMGDFDPDGPRSTLVFPPTPLRPLARVLRSSAPKPAIPFAWRTPLSFSFCY